MVAGNCLPDLNGRRWALIGVVAVVVSFFVAGILIGHFAIPARCNDDGLCLGTAVPRKLIEDATPGITEKIVELMKAENIGHFLRNYTSYPHLAGTPGEDRLAQTLYETWIEQGLDYVTTDTYNVLLSYPNRTDPSYVFLYDANGVENFRTQRVEKILSADQNHTDVVPPFNAYSPPGNVTGPLVYVNYGRVEDYDTLKEVYNDTVNITGAIVIVRYGKIFRGDKVHIAASHGAVGLIIYSDPIDYSIGVDNSVYPESWWLPGTGVQRGTVYTGPDGDPLTPGYPSTETAYRRPESNADLPLIPVHPIGYEDAYRFLSKLGGPEALAAWGGKLNFTYRVGPGFTDEFANWTVRLYVATYNEKRPTTNVFAYINGSVEPDRYVLMGNHRDAWVFGSLDPTSGTAAMMEVSRVLATLVKQGWRPRRTIVFCSWGAEEYGLIGSYEWVEHYLKNLMDRAVVYLNFDMALEGVQSIRARGLPIVTDFIYDVAKRIKSANNATESLYDEWLRYFPSAKDKTRPRIVELGSGSDYASFIGIAGVPSLDVRYTHNYSIASYPLYHSVYETSFLVTNILDKDFSHSLAISQWLAEAARYMSDSLFLPLSATRYAEGLRGYIEDLNDGYGQMMRTNNVPLDALEAASTNFNRTATEFAARRETINTKNPMATRAYNDQLMRLERAFLDSNGLPPGRPLHKHVLYAPSIFDSYAGTSFPGLVDLMWKIEDVTDEAEKQNRWNEVRKHLATIIYAIDSAVTVLRDTSKFN